MYPAMLVTSTTRITSDETRNTTARTDLQWKVYLNKIQSSLIIFSIVVSASVKVVFLVVCCGEIFFYFLGGAFLRSRDATVCVPTGSTINP